MSADATLPESATIADGGGHAVDAAAPPVATAIEWLVDNARTYDALVTAVAAARATIWITQLALDADCVAYATGARVGDVLLLDALDDAARGGVDVRVLLNASLLLDTTRALRRVLRERKSPIQLRGVSRFPQLLHAKTVIIDAREAFVIGSPFVNGYWDDSTHRPVDARRPQRELGGRPLHDVSFRTIGTMATQLAAYFAHLWNDVGCAKHNGAAPATPPAAPTVPTAIHIARTAARGMHVDHPAGATEILNALLDGIAYAASSIYIEHQYLSARPVICALADALDRNAALELVVLLNQNPDITAYRGWQNARLAEAGLLAHPRVGLFALWSAEMHDGTRALNQVFVHSKVVTIDDRWVTAGSANLDGVSLHSYGDDFTGRIARRVFRDVRNFDVNVVVDGRRDAESSAARDLRERLWREHLGSATLASGLEGGLARWRDHAARNVQTLNAPVSATTAIATTMILPYSTRSAPMDQLADVGVDVRGSGVALQFNPGWLELHASPNWVRNMFT